MANIIQKKRFANEKKMLEQEPLHYSSAFQAIEIDGSNEKNSLIWYFIIFGQEDSEYYGGKYIGKITHSNKYPVEPPAYEMLTPNGRFEILKDICLTNSKFHKGEWSSTWNIKTILIAFNSIFYADDTTGISHIKKTKEERIKLALESDQYNKDNYPLIYEKFMSFNYIFHVVPKK